MVRLVLHVPISSKELQVVYRCDVIGCIYGQHVKILVVGGEEEDVDVGQSYADNEPQVTVPVTNEETLYAPSEPVVRRSDRIKKQTQFYQAGH